MGSGRSGSRQNLTVDALDGLALNVDVSGDGPAVLLLHGFTGSTATWEYLRSRLEPSHKVVAIDLPGHGKSSAPARPDRYSLDRLTGDLARALDALEIESALVAGYSMGGRAALRFILDRPERAAGLILESTSPGIESADERAQRARLDEELADFIETEGIEAFVKRWEMLPLWESQKALPPEITEELRRQRLAGNPAGLANSLRGAGAGANEPVTERLSEIEVAALLVAGELDAKYTAIMREMQRSIRGSRLAIIDGAGHTVHLERPEAFATVVADFVNEVFPV